MRAHRATWLVLLVAAVGAGGAEREEKKPVSEPKFHIQLETIHSGFDGKMCWVHARAGAIPGNPPSVVLTMQKLLLSGSDVFYALNEMRSDDLGKTWTGPKQHETLSRRKQGDIEVCVCDFTPKWHAKSRRLLGTGHNVHYRNNRVMHYRHRQVAYSVYDTDKRSWDEWRTVEMPDNKKFFDCGAGSGQRYDLPNGDILLPVYCKDDDPKEKCYSVTVLRCRFDGETLSYVGHGTELELDVPRGFCEPSIAKFKDCFFLTLRNDRAGYVTSGPDGLRYAKPKQWCFDDGKPLGNYNTQQHWAVHPKEEGLFLVYTRYVKEGKHPASKPEATYDWLYFRDLPLVYVRAAMRQETACAWNEIHFLELNFTYESFPRWGGGNPVKEGAFKVTNKGFHFSNWGARMDGQNAIGVVRGGQALFHDGRGGYGTYLHAYGDLAWKGWRDCERQVAAWLWMGSDERPVSAVPAAAGVLPDSARVVPTTKTVRAQIDAARAAVTGDTPDGRRKRWRVALAERLEAQGRLNEVAPWLEGEKPASRTTPAAGELALVLENPRTAWPCRACMTSARDVSCFPPGPSRFSR